MHPDIAVIVTLHGETVVASPTIRSAEAAIASAEAEGLSVERILGFDAATDDCRAFFGEDKFPDWRRIDLEMRDQGLARNALVEASTARWIAFLDGDDLWSENWLTCGARLLADAERAGRCVIVHPELNWFFDQYASCLANVAQDDPLFVPEYTYFANPYDALAIAPRAAHLEHPYVGRDLARSGFAVEDWQWALETMAAGWNHEVARDTIIFKRRREASQSANARQAHAVTRQLDALCIDRIDHIRGTDGAGSSGLAERG